jgi:phosphohistidine phosphatase
MPKLFILRHAQAASDFHSDDHARPLTPFGMNQARAQGEHLKNIDLALCSSANRTRLTLENAMRENTPHKIKYSDDLYNASAEKLIIEIQKEEAENLLVIAHNPGIHQMAHMLAKEEPSDKYEELGLTYPPATLTILECPVGSWAELNPGQNTLIDYIQADRG